MGDVAVAATIFNEARGESPAGRQAVKAVIQNREGYRCPFKNCGKNHGLSDWRKTSVFHGFSASKPNVPEAEKKVWDECVQLASKTVADNTGGATHFQRGGFNATQYESKGTIGKHQFARERTEVTRHAKSDL